MRIILSFIFVIGIVLAQTDRKPLRDAAKNYDAAAALLNTDPLAPPAPAIKTGKTIKKEDAPVPVTRVFPMPLNTSQALSLSEQALAAEPEISSDSGKVVYAYPGKGAFPIVCAPVQITTISFEPGEVVDEKNIDIGLYDKAIVHELHSAGSGPSLFYYLDLRAISQGVETTMTVGTSKRVYYFRVILADKHMTQVAFVYPEEETARRKSLEEARMAETEHEAALKKMVVPADIVNWKYTKTFHGKDAKLMDPVSVGDDKTRTYIQLSEKIRKIGLPVIEVHDAAGVVAANFSWRGTEMVVDAVFKEACLLNGVGKQQQRVCIKNAEGATNANSN